MSDAEGPYKVKNNRFWWHVDGIGDEDRLNQWAYKLGAEWWADRLNDAYAAGRASRDGLKKALEELLDHHTGRICSEVDESRGYRKCSDVVNQASKAIEDDEAGE